MATKGFRPGVGNIANYTEGKLKQKISQYSTGGTTDVSNLTTKISSSYDDHNNLAGDLVIEKTLNVSGNFSTAGNISGSGKGYFEKDVEVADNLLVSGSGTFVGNLSSSGKAYFEKDVEIADNLSISGSVTIGADADGTDRTITFGHSTLKTTIGIDDDQDVFAINTDNAFEAANDFEINASGDVTLANGDLYVDTIRRASDSGTTTKILLNDEIIKLYAGHSSDEVVNVSSGAIAVAGNISGSGKGYFEKDVEIADSLLVSGSSTIVGTANVGRISGSTAQSSVLLGDLVIGAKDGTNAGIYVSGSANIDKSVYALKFSGSSANTSTLLGDLILGSKNGTAANLVVSGAATIGGDLTVNGTTTTVNSTTVTIDDPIFTLGGDTAPGSDDNKDRGIEFNWHNGSAAKVGFFGFDDSTGYFTFVPDASNSSEVFSGTKGTVDVGGLIASGIISGSGKAYFEKDVEIADNLLVTGSATVGSLVANGIISGSGKAYFEKDLEIADNLLVTGSATVGSLVANGIISGSGKAYFEKDLEIADNLLVTGSITSKGNVVVGADADGTDRTITFGHSTLKSVIGIDDSGDVFAINTDNAFEAANDLQIDTNGNVSLGNGNLAIGTDADGSDRTITFGHSTLKSVIGIDDSGDVFAINTDDAFEAANDLQIDASGEVTLGNGGLSVAGNISGSGKAYFEKDVEIADNLKVTGSATIGSAATNTFSIDTAGRVSGSAGAIFEGDIVTADNIAATGSITAGTGFTLGTDADGTDRIITFGHSTLKSVIGIDDSGDVFAINTDDAFEAANDLQIDANGHVTLGNGNLVIGADADGTDRTITFGHSTLKSTIGIDDSGDVFAINTDNAFEAANDLQIDANGNVSLGNGALSVAGNVSGSGKGYFEKDVEIADNLFVSGNLGVGTSSTLSASINTNGNIRDVKYSNGAGARSSLRLAKAKGSEASPAVVTNAHSVGQVEFSAFDGANYVECASIVAKISGTPGADDMPGALHFATTADGAKEVSDRMVITEAGNTYFSGNVKIADDQRLYFGTGNECFIEYDENNSDFLVISGSDSGMVLSGSTVQIRGTLEGASPLMIAGGVEMVASENGGETSFTFGDGPFEFSGSFMALANERTLHFGDMHHCGLRNASGSWDDSWFDMSGSNICLSGSLISTTGKIGVGITLESDGITHGITLPNTTGVTGKVKANAYTTYSSARYKNNIKPIQNALDTLCSIEGVTYRWKSSDLEDIGFIAEDVGKVMPEIVEWESDGVNAQSMDYTRITPVLVEAVKEQQTQIKKQKKLIEQLFEKIEELKKDS